MDGFDFFRRVFGMPGNGRGNAFKNPPWDEYDYDEWDELDDVELPPGNGQTAPGFSFRVFSGDPFDMHRDFEKQMDEVMRTFMGLMGPIQQFPVLPDEPALPHIEGDSHKHNFLKPAEDLPRNRYLKPTYESSQSSTARADSDLDGRITGNELDSLFDQAVAKPVAPKTRFFGQSTFSKTVRGPDGRVEHHKTFKSSDGTEQTVITRQLGEQSHSVTVKKNQDGTTEQLEDFINMDEGDLNKFNQIWDVRRGTVPVPALVPPPPPPREDSNSWASKFLKWFK